MNLQNRLTKQLQTMSVWKREIFKWSRGDPEKDKQFAADLQREPLLAIGNVDPTNADLKQLHSASMHGRKKELQEVLQKGIWVDFPNDAGQTALFCATLRGHYATVELLLLNGANPNEKSDTGMTPVHVACLRASIRALGAMIEAGGDLRLHDNEGNGCLDWARYQPDPKKRMKMMEFIQKSQLFALNYSGDFVYNSLDRQPSILQMLRGKVSSQMSLDFSQDTALRRVHSHGYGRVYYGGESASGIVSIIPLLTENQLRHDSDGISFDSTCGFTMTGMLWNMTPITMKQPSKPLDRHHSVDLLISEVEHLSKLRHPNILLLMGLCQARCFDNLMLAFERVSVGSLHYILHEKIDHLPMTYIRDISSQVCQALVYIHGQNYLHCSLTSHAVCMVSMHQAKVCNLEYMVEMKKASTGRCCLVATSPHRDHFFKWMAPEVMLGNPPSAASDVYSFCCILWEMITSELPWKSKTASELLEMHTSGTAQLPAPRKSVALFQSMIEEGLKNNKSRPRDFTILLHWLQGPLDKAASWKPSPVDRLKSLQRESKERISISSRPPTVFDSLAASSASADQTSSTLSESTEDSSSIAVLTLGTQPLRAIVGKDNAAQAAGRGASMNVSRNRSDATNNHCSVEQLKTEDASSSCSSADNNEAALDADAVDGNSTEEVNTQSSQSRKRIIVRSAGEIGTQASTRNKDHSAKHHFGHSVSFSAAKDLQTYSRRAGSLPWHRSLGVHRDDGTLTQLFGLPTDRSVGTDKSPERSCKTLPLVKPASHLTDIKDFSKDNTDGATQTVDFVPRRKRRLSPRRSLPATRNFPVISPRAFPRSKSASGDVLEMKDVELSIPGSVRTLTEHFQERLYHHNLRQSILRGSMNPQGIQFEDFFAPSSPLPQTPNMSEIPPEGSKETGTKSEDREILTTSSADSSESLTSVSLQYESSTDEDHVSPVSTRSDLYIADDNPVSKPYPVYPPLSTSVQCQPAANLKHHIFQGNSAFRKLSKQRAVEIDSTNDNPDTPQRNWKKSQFLPSSLPGIDISSHPFDFQDYYIDDDYTGISSDDPNRPTSIRNRECEATHITGPSRERVRSHVWLGDSKKGQRQKSTWCQQEYDEGQNWRLNRQNIAKDDREENQSIQNLWQNSAKDERRDSPDNENLWHKSSKDEQKKYQDEQKLISRKRASDFEEGEEFHSIKHQYFEIPWQGKDIDEKQIPERDYNQEAVIKSAGEQDQDETKDRVKTKEQHMTQVKASIIESRMMEEADASKEHFFNWRADQDQTDSSKFFANSRADHSEAETDSNRQYFSNRRADHGVTDQREQIDETRFKGRESRWEEFVRRNKKRTPTKHTGFETIPEQSESDESHKEDENGGQDELGPWRQEDGACAVADTVSDHSGKDDVQPAAEEEEFLLSVSDQSSLSTVVENPRHTLLSQPVSDADDDDDNDTTLVLDDVVDPPRCIVLNLERNTLSQEDIHTVKTMTSPRRDTISRPLPKTQASRVEGTDSPLARGGPSQKSTFRRFYLGSTAGSQGYSTSLRVESSLQNLGSHHIKQTATDTSSGVTQTVHEETVLADTLRTTMTIQ